MIPNTRPLTARYVSGAGTKVNAKPVAAWSDDGDALVADEQNGRLVLARSYAGFDGLDVDDRYVAVVDGGGWTVGYSAGGDESDRVPVVAFAISETGEGTPITCDGDGMVEPDRLADSRTFHPPGGWPEDRKAGDVS